MHSRSLDSCLISFVLLHAFACGSNHPPADAGGDTGVPDAGPPALPDLSIDGPRARETARVYWQYFPPDSCAIVEGCIAAPGWRRLLGFATFTPNHGNADLTLGDPSASPDRFEYSPCHRHYHFRGYADYRLFDAMGREVGSGHKQAFCLMDSERLPTAGPSDPLTARYDCDNQGIQRGWGDLYDAGLDCQWVDVTDVPPGTYTLRITINGERQLPEASYDDNVATVTVTIPADTEVDPLAPCDRQLDGARDCGWTNFGSFDCRPGARLRIGCGSGCGLGSCNPDQDAILRVCPGDTPCSSRHALAYGDDGCGDPMSLCPVTEFTCPESGRYTVLVAPFVVGQEHSCRPAAMVLREGG
jgi:hypothetical protein